MSSRSSPIVIGNDEPPPVSSSPGSVQLPLLTAKSERPLPFFIALPRLSIEKKRLYRPFNQTSLGKELETPVDEVIGEYCDRKTLYYFARYDGGIAHKV